MQRYAGKTIVVKYGGHAMGDGELRALFAQRHRAAEAGRHQPDRRPWRRAADRPDAGAARDQERASSTACASPTRRPWKSSRWSWPARSTSRSSPRSTPPAACAVGLSGKDGNLIEARKLRRTSAIRSRQSTQLDLGFVGEPGADQPARAATCSPDRHHPGDRADRRRRRAARPTTSTPTRWPAPSRRGHGAERLLLLTDVAGRARQEPAS